MEVIIESSLKGTFISECTDQGKYWKKCSCGAEFRMLEHPKFVSVVIIYPINQCSHDDCCCRRIFEELEKETFDPILFIERR